MNEPRSSEIEPRTFRKVAVVHDWLTGMRGGEQVLEGILELFPAAEVFTLFHFPGAVSPVIESRRIHVSWLQGLASRIADYRVLLPLYPAAVRRWRFNDFDLVLSSSHCVAKGVDPKSALHVSYCHTPMRYVWDRFDDYFPPNRPLRRLVMKVIAPFLRRWDVATASRVTAFAANSEFVRERIRRYYRRDAEVIHPFVDRAFLETPLEAARDDYHLVVSALVPYKRVELAVAAATAAGKRLRILGGGPLLEQLRATAGPNIEVAGPVSRARIIEALSRARSLILPGIEDFGITPLEAMAVGTPVVAFRAGGALDTVIDGVTGIFFDQPSVESLRAAMEAAERREWDRGALRAHAATFSRERFQERLMSLISATAGTA
ncbi:MAG TPA: glycosyltransferase [Thermoanaerobaculia bacterium]|nr:glycosyltransferase [Thermoanaerobaculia bacterium]